MAIRTNKLTKLGVPRKIRSDKLMPDTLVACCRCGLELPHALLSKARLCRRCSWERFWRVFTLVWDRKEREWAEWQATRQKSKQKGGNNGQER